MTKYAIATRMTGAILGLSLSVVSTIALAHHGFQSRYDMGKPIWIEGIVECSYFGNPHAELTVKIAADLAIPQPAPTLGPRLVLPQQCCTPRSGRSARSDG
jgi:hypothetical protein